MKISPMKTSGNAHIVAAIALFAVARGLIAQDFDFRTLDKLGANAKSTTNVTLDGETLKMAAGFLGKGGDKDSASVKAVVDNLKGIYVRAYEFDKPGQYAETDLAPLRAYLKQPKWKNIVDVRDDKESTQVYFLPSPGNNKLEGVVVVSTAPTELTVVFIDGELNMSDLQRLSGNMGIPDIGLTGGDKSAGKKTDRKSDK
jgi:hypothetical protein